ncbi:hypothetical protein ACFQ3Z_24345 [Streptomyces nogalater]
MAWRDRLRRRSAGTGGVRRGEREGAPAAAVPGAPAAAAPDAPAASVPADWDGGWRRTAPPELTVSRAPLGVSDGLAFRSGLAAWQNPSFDSGLAHALLPTAPTGLVHGVTRRPATPRSAPAEGARCCCGRCGGRGPGSDGRAGTGRSGHARFGFVRFGFVRFGFPGRGGFPGFPGFPWRGRGEGRPGVARSSRALTSADSPAVLSPSSPPSSVPSRPEPVRWRLRPTPAAGPPCRRFRWYGG